MWGSNLTQILVVGIDVELLQGVCQFGNDVRGEESIHIICLENSYPRLCQGERGGDV